MRICNECMGLGIGNYPNACNRCSGSGVYDSYSYSSSLYVDSSLLRTYLDDFHTDVMQKINELHTESEHNAKISLVLWISGLSSEDQKRAAKACLVYGIPILEVNSNKIEATWKGLSLDELEIKDIIT